MTTNKEREAVVAWLRKNAAEALTQSIGFADPKEREFGEAAAGIAEEIANRVERGEHMKGEQ